MLHLGYLGSCIALNLNSPIPRMNSFYFIVIACATTIPTRMTDHGRLPLDLFDNVPTRLLYFGESVILSAKFAYGPSTLFVTLRFR